MEKVKRAVLSCQTQKGVPNSSDTHMHVQTQIHASVPKAEKDRMGRTWPCANRTCRLQAYVGRFILKKSAAARCMGIDQPCAGVVNSPHLPPETALKLPHMFNALAIFAVRGPLPPGKKEGPHDPLRYSCQVVIHCFTRCLLVNRRLRAMRYGTCSTWGFAPVKFIKSAVD